MKKFYAILCLTIASLTQLQAQAPQGFNYQATVRNSSGDLVVNTNVYFKFNIIQGSQTAVPIFTETHYVPTDDLGQVNLVIGQGTANTGVFSELDWSLGSYYLGIELDTGSGYVAMGTTQLLSVPYALYAENSGNSTPTTPTLQSVLAENNSAGQQQIKDLLEPTDGADAVTKSYVDALSNTQGLMNFNGWDNYQVWNDGTSVQLTPNSFVFVNANDTTLIFPDGPENCCFGDVIYVYVMDGDPLTPLSFNLQANGFPVAVGGGDMPLEFTSTDIISGEFWSVGLKTIVNVGDYWMVADFQGQIITDSDIDNDGDGFTENQGDCDDNNATIYPPVIPTFQQITICSGDTFVFDPVNNPPTTLVPDGTTYTWAVQENTSIITGQSSSNNNQSQISQTLVNSTSDIYGLVYGVTPYSSSGCEGSVFQLSVLVVPSPVLEPINDMVLMNGEFGEIAFYAYTGEIATITYDWVSDIDFGAGLSGVGNTFAFLAANSSSIPITGIVTVSATVTYNGISCVGPSETFTVTVCAEEIQDGIDNDCDGNIDEGFDYAGISGTWKLAPEAGALGVGPELDNISWWSNTSDDVTTRACLFDDEYIFNTDGSFQNVVGSETWIETWQGAAAEGCGTPVAPHDGTASATYTYDEAAGSITLNGTGAHLGLAKVINGAELASPGDAPDSITYMAALSEDGNTLELDIEVAGGGHWSFKLVKDVIPEGVEGTWKLAPEAGALGVGPELDNISWWSNSSDDVTTRACLFDDEYVFGSDGSFQNVVGADTWIEGWQGAASEECGAPVAPHDGTASATYTYDAAAETITLNGVGAYLGLAKVINGAELASPGDAPDSITYIAALSEDGNTLELDIEVSGGGHWSFKLARQ